MEQAMLERALDGGLAMLALLVLFMMTRSAVSLIGLFRTQGQERQQGGQVADKLTTLLGEMSATSANVIATNTAATLRISDTMERLADVMERNTTEMAAMKDMLALTSHNLDKYQSFVDDSLYGLADAVRRLSNQLMPFETRMERVLDSLESLQTMEARAETAYQVMARAIDADRLGRIRMTLEEVRAEEHKHETNLDSDNDPDGTYLRAGADGAGAGSNPGGGWRAAGPGADGRSGNDHSAGLAAGGNRAGSDAGAGGVTADSQPGAGGVERELPGRDGGDGDAGGG